jgi:hypothetical protein
MRLPRFGFSMVRVLAGERHTMWGGVLSVKKVRDIRFVVSL